MPSCLPFFFFLDWRVHAGTVNSTSNQATFEAILDSSDQFADPSTASYNGETQGVVVLQHDIYVESVNLAIGYTLPFALQHDPQFKLSTVTECQPRSDRSGKNSLADAYLETNTDMSNPAWVAVQSGNNGDSTVTTSVIVENGTSRTITYAMTGTQTPGTNAAAGSLSGVRSIAIGGLAVMFSIIFGGLVL